MQGEVQGRSTIIGSRSGQVDPSKRQRGLIFIPLLGLLVGAVLTGALWWHANKLSQQDAQEVFNQRVSYANLAIDRILSELTGLLSMVRSVTENNPRLNEQAFEALMLGQNQRLFSAGLQYIGFIKAASQARCLEANSNLPSDAGAAPAMLGEGCLDTVLVYPRPTNEHVLGPIRVIEKPALSGAIIRAMDYGYLALTPPLPASRETNAEPGLLIYLPVYRQNESLATVPARRRALAGLVVAAISLEDLVRAELGGDYFQTINLQIRDYGLVGRARSTVQDSTLVLDAQSLVRRQISAENNLADPEHLLTTDRQHAGRFWSVAFSEISGDRSLLGSFRAPWMILVLGCLLTSVLVAYLHTLVKQRKRAEQLAMRMTQHLHEREGQLHLALDAVQMGSWTWRPAPVGFDADARSSALLGLGNGPIDDLFARLHADDRRAARKSLERAIQESCPFYIEARLASVTNGVRWVEISAQLTCSESQQVTHATGLVRNVTDRVEMILAKRQLLSKLINAEEKERRRIARELHDQLGQEITALSLGLRNLQEMTNVSDARLDLLKGLKKLVSDIDSRVDRFTLDLRPVVLDDLGLQAALEAHFNQWIDVHGTELNSHLSGLADTKLPFEVVTTVFRVVQESLTNVARHAQASRVDVIVELSSAEIKVVVEDNGSGQKSPVGPHSYGLMGMRERVEALGGQFRAESSIESGFSVFVRLPIAIENQALVTQ